MQLCQIHFYQKIARKKVLRASVTQADGTPLEEVVEIAPECNFLHTLWSHCDLHLNDALMT